MLNSHIRPSRDLRNNYAGMVNILKAHDHIVITNKGVGEAVLIGIEDFTMYEEFLHHRFIYNELQKSKEKSNNPEIKLLSAQAVFSGIAKRLDDRGL